MRASESFKSQINEESYARLKEEYAFMGSVGDQVIDPRLIESCKSYQIFTCFRIV